MVHRVTGVDDILHDKHVSAFDRAAQIFENADFSTAFHAVTVGRCLKEVDFDRQIQFAHQIGNKHETASQQAHDHQLVRVFEFGLNLSTQIFYSGGDRFGGNHLVYDIWPLRHGLPLDLGIVPRHIFVCRCPKVLFKPMPTHSETRFLPYSAQQMYDLVANVSAYPEFLPWCAAARIRVVTAQADHEVMEADLVISFKVFRERFASRVVLWPDTHKIDTEYLDGPFRYMKSNWKFCDVEGGCEVFFFVDFEFRNAILQGIIGVVFNEAMQRIVRAFERRAAVLYY